MTAAAPPDEAGGPEAPRPAPEAEPAPEAPPARVEFHPHRPKLRILTALVALIAAVLMWNAPGAETPAPVIGTAILLGLGAALSWRAAADPRPVLAVDAEGLEDRLHGRVPWSEVGFFRAQGGLAPGFGWGLKPGRRPPRLPTLFRVQATFNTLSGLPPRSYRRKLTLGSPEEMAAACRAHRPELEGGG